MTAPTWLRRILATRLLRDGPTEPVAFAGLAAASLLAGAATLSWGAPVVPLGSQVLPLIGGSLLLTRGSMRRLLAVVAASVLVTVITQGVPMVRPGTVVVVSVTGLLTYQICLRRQETGLVGLRGDSVLAELRRRLTHQGAVPVLPPGWGAEARVSPAGGGPFSGDFVVSALVGEPACLELALVDVSGKGVAAGTRSLMLSGAIGGLLGARDPADLLPSANAYLLRQAWEEGFATAAHLVLDLATGAFTLESAGHPPAVTFDAGNGRWTVLQAAGPALGLLPDVGYSPVRGRLGPGDALLLYTDGLVEVPGQDLDLGIDRLVGEAERLVATGFAGGCDALLQRVAVNEGDDRGVVLIWREP